jgi:hypothetical protein
MKRTGWTASIRFTCARSLVVRALVLVIWALTLAGAGDARAMASAQPAATVSIQAFYGAYEGESISVSDENLGSDEDLGKRDLAIAIVPRKNGFNLTWTTVTYAEGSSASRKTYSIDFVPTRRGNIYASAMRTDLFGNRVPLNPLEGDPFVWATLHGKTLTVYALLITPAGGYEMQTYHRTLTSQGLRLEFSRVRNGSPLRFITGTLVRIG